LPLLGTTLGASCVFFLKQSLDQRLKEALCGFAGGVMIAASVWSLIIPALEYESAAMLGAFSFFPALLGVWLGVLFLLLMDKLIPEESFKSLKENRMLMLSVSLHNLPEGMAVGVAYALILANGNLNDIGMAFVLSLGIAIQNFPEGAIVSMPLVSEKMRKSRAFLYGFLSGVIEPIAAFITLFSLALVFPLLPYLLGFAAGAMIYAVIRELCPVITKNESSNIGVIFFLIGFSVMMVLDVTLG
jgi:ZIP family zinc transporter